MPPKIVSKLEMCLPKRRAINSLYISIEQWGTGIVVGLEEISGNQCKTVCDKHKKYSHK